VRGAVRVLGAEWARLVSARSARVCAALLVLVPALRVVAAVAGEKLERLERDARGLSSVGLDEGTAWGPLVDGWRAGLTLGVALVLVHAARALAGDRESGVLRIALTRSASRAGALLGRAMLGPLMAVLVALLSGVGALAAAAAVGDLGDLVEDGFTITTAAELRGELVAALLVTTLGLAAVHAFGLFVATLVRGAVVALAAALATVLLWDVFKTSTGEARWWVFASHAPTFVDGSAMSEMSGVARGYSDKGTPPEIFRKGLLLAPLSGLVLIGAAALVLRRRDL
jgi:hypothetical protein